jgi:hypothetical protein
MGDSVAPEGAGLAVAAPVGAVVGAYLELADRRLPGVVEGLYLVGSVALADWQPGSDVDFVAATSRPLTPSTLGVLAEVHADLAARAATGQPAPQFDGVYVGWQDLTRPPQQAQPAPYHLDGRFVADEDCFEANPATWQTLHDHGVAVRGPAPVTLGIWRDPGVLAGWTVANLNDYWAGWIDASDRALAAKAPTDTIDGDLGVWGVLGIARLHATLLTGEIVSKSAAGRHALAAFAPRWHPIVEMCLAIRQRPAGAPAARLSVAQFAEALGLMRVILDDANRHVQ